MRCPTLTELPPPPPGKSGWPWTEESLQLPDTMPDGFPWPRVSIVTPSYNQAEYIEETIRSVLLQGYANLEYIIIDGGSTDGSVEIIRKYEPWLAYWVSEPDKGQSEALNKGFQRATGSIVAWLNSDDWYLPSVLPQRVAELTSRPETVLVYGDCNLINETGDLIRTYRTRPCTASSLLLVGNQIPQQSVLMKTSALAAAGWLNPSLQHIMDYELWLRLSRIGDLHYMPGTVANFRYHGLSKSLSVGYEFVSEKLAWLSRWPGLDEIVTDSQRAEVFRRHHTRAALEAVFAGEEEKATHHLQIALEDGVWPYGQLDSLAERIVRIRGLAGQSVVESATGYNTLRRVLRQVEPARKGNRLWRRVAFQYHKRRCLHSHRAHDNRAVIVHLVKALWYSPSWLWSRPVLRIGAELILGRRVSDWLRHRIRLMSSPNS